jgi:arylsulfatase A-like enzyme
MLARALFIPMAVLAAAIAAAQDRPNVARERAAGPASMRGQAPSAATGRRPNILVAIADDWSFGHAGAYGDRAVRTPNFDRVAREGALFTHAFTASPSCTPSRAALLTGQAIHRLDESGNLWSTLRRAHAVYPDLLEAAGYAVGHSGKGWGPGRVEPGGRDRNPAGPRFESFDAFLRQRPEGRPFCFWFGSSDPHRPYAAGTGATLPAGAAAVTVPPFLPDTPEVRADLLDYSFEVERFDRDLGALLAALERIGELEHTIVVVTSDNGMPFPRAKANVYDAGARMPLAIRWPAAVAGGTRVDAFVSLTDLAPTLLEAAGQPVPAAVTGRSLLALLRGGPAPPDRDRAFIERERHANVRRGDASYPVRAVRTREYLYVRNFRPERAPAGDAELVFAVGPFGDIDGGPTKSLLLDRRADSAIAPFFALATAARPADELYHLPSDPHQLTNVAGRPEHEAARLRLRGALDAWMRETGDPRAGADDDRWDRFPYYGPPAASEGGLPGDHQRAAAPRRRRLRPRRGAPASSR